MVSSSKFSILAAAAVIACAIRPINSQRSEGEILEIIGSAAWGETCLNYVSATVATTGLAMHYMMYDPHVDDVITKGGGAVQLPGEVRTAHFGNSFDCNVKKTKEECLSSKTRHGIGCGWCDHSTTFGWDPRWEKFFGEGSCYISIPFTQLGCSVLSVGVFGPMVDDLQSRGITPPSVDRQAKCFLQSFDLEKCNEDPDCTSCEIPDVYGLRWSNTPPGKTTTVCGVKELLDDQGAGWCAKMNAVPALAYNFLLDQDNVSSRNKMSGKMGQLVFSSKDDAVVHTTDYVPRVDFVPSDKPGKNVIDPKFLYKDDGKKV